MIIEEDYYNRIFSNSIILSIIEKLENQVGNLNVEQCALAQFILTKAKNIDSKYKKRLKEILLEDQTIKNKRNKY